MQHKRLWKVLRSGLFAMLVAAPWAAQASEFELNIDNQITCIETTRVYDTGAQIFRTNQRRVGWSGLVEIIIEESPLDDFQIYTRELILTPGMNHIRDLPKNSSERYMKIKFHFDAGVESVHDVQPKVWGFNLNQGVPSGYVIKVSGDLDQYLSGKVGDLDISGWEPISSPVKIVGGVMLGAAAGGAIAVLSRHDRQMNAQCENQPSTSTDRVVCSIEFEPRALQLILQGLKLPESSTPVWRGVFASSRSADDWVRDSSTCAESPSVGCQTFSAQPVHEGLYLGIGQPEAAHLLISNPDARAVTRISGWAKFSWAPDPAQ